MYQNSSKKIQKISEKIIREKCLHLVLLNNKNRHQISNERIDAANDDVRSRIDVNVLYIPCSAPVLIS